MRYTLEEAVANDQARSLTYEEKIHIINLFREGLDFEDIVIKSRKSKVTVHKFLVSSGLYREECCLGSKKEAYYKKESDILKGYIAPTFEELTEKEREFYFKKYAKFKIDDGIPVVGRKPIVSEPVLH